MAPTLPQYIYVVLTASFPLIIVIIIMFHFVVSSVGMYYVNTQDEVFLFTIGLVRFVLRLFYPQSGPSLYILSVHHSLSHLLFLSSQCAFMLFIVILFSSIPPFTFVCCCMRH